MAIFSENVESLEALYTSELQKALDLEETIVKALPKMVEKSTDPQLKQAFQSHLQESETHVEKVKQLLSKTKESGSKKCKVIHALVSEAEDAMSDVTDPGVLDVALIGAGQQVEHHEIAVYGTLKAWARLLDRHECAQTIESIEKDEFHADKLLSQVADRINSNALAAA